MFVPITRNKYELIIKLILCGREMNLLNLISL